MLLVSYCPPRPFSFSWAHTIIRQHVAGLYRNVAPKNFRWLAPSNRPHFSVVIFEMTHLGAGCVLFVRTIDSENNLL